MTSATSTDRPAATAPAAESEPPHHSIGGRIRNYFLTGLIVTGPVAITIYLTWSFVNWVDGLVRPLFPEAFRPETYLPIRRPATFRSWSSKSIRIAVPASVLRPPLNMTSTARNYMVPTAWAACPFRARICTT